jgi:hypothetical protein
MKVKIRNDLKYAKKIIGNEKRHTEFSLKIKIIQKQSQSLEQNTKSNR